MSLFAHSAIIDSIAALCVDTSAAILRYYGDNSRLNTRQKTNHTPLTEADLLAHRLLTSGLPKIINLPVISEESDPAIHQQQHRDYWLIDPIDGTRDFIEGRGQFSILIARITDHRPSLALIYAPVTHTYWYASPGEGSFRTTPDGHTQRLQCRALPEKPTVITARMRLSHRMETYLHAAFGPYQHITSGSALKYCAIAEGRADLYPKIAATTSEWDSAAGELILQEAGGGVAYLGHSTFYYGRREIITNPPFIAYGANVSATLRNYWFDEMEKLLTKW